MRLRRKLAAAALCLCAALALGPAAAFAATWNSIFVGGMELGCDEEHPVYALTTEDGAVDPSGADEDNYNIKWDGSTLTLRDAKVTQGFYQTDDDRGIRAAIYRWGDFAIELAGDNVVEGPDSDSASPADTLVSAGIYADGSLAIGGTGTLEVAGGAVEAGAEACSYGIGAERDLSISGGSIEAAGGTASATGSSNLRDAFSAGINVYGAFNMTSGTVKASADEATGVFASSYGIGAGKVIVGSGTVEAAGGTATSKGDGEVGFARSVGVITDEDLAITGGDVTATGGWSTGATWSHSSGIECYGKVQIQDATVRVQSDEAQFSAGMLANGESVVIENAAVQAVGGRASASSAAIQADGGDLTINDSEVVASISLSEGDAANGIYAFGNISIDNSTVSAAGPTSGVDGVTPAFASGIFSEVGNITIAGADTSVCAISGAAREGVAAIATQGGNIVIQGGAVQADGASCCDPWSADPESGFIGYGLCALKYEDGTGGDIVISGGNVAAVGFTDSLSYEGDLTARPGDGKIAMSVMDEWARDRETYEADWAGMAENALEIEGSPFAEETVVERALTEGKLYFHAVGVKADPVDPEEPVDPVDPEEPEEPVDPTDPVDPEGPADPVNPAKPTDPAKPSDSGQQTGDANSNADLPKTGDSFNSVVCLGLLLASATAMTAGAVCSRRKKGVR